MEPVGGCAIKDLLGGGGFKKFFPIGVCQMIAECISPNLPRLTDQVLAASGSECCDPPMILPTCSLGRDLLGHQLKFLVGGPHTVLCLWVTHGGQTKED